MKKIAIVGSLLVSLLSTLVMAADKVDTEIIANWELNQKVGTVAHDSSVNKFNLELNNGANWITWQPQGGISLNGVNGFLKSYQNQTLNIPGSFSFIAWVNPDNLPQGVTFSSSTPVFKAPRYSSLLAKGVYGKRGFEINFKDEYLNVRKIDDEDDFTSSASFQNGRWQQLAITWDDKEKIINFYRDGRPINSVTPSSNIFSPEKDDMLIIGSNISGDDHIYSGYLSNIRLYKGALSSSEIANLYSKNNYAFGRAGFLSSITYKLSQLASIFSYKINSLLNFLK